MDTKSRIYFKAAAIENRQFGSSSNNHACTESPFINGLIDLQHCQGMLLLYSLTQGELLTWKFFSSARTHAHI